MSIYIEFHEIKMIDSTGKTKIWNVLQKRSGSTLGKIKWYGPWRQYCFFPVVGTVFNKTCMDDIGRFIKEQMAYRGIKKSGGEIPK